MTLKITIEIDTMDPAMADAIYSGISDIVKLETRRSEDQPEVNTLMIFNPNR